MLKYKVEGNIDFFSELYKSLDVQENNNNNNVCLITNEELTDKYVTMTCGHKFNYVPLYKYLVNQKKKFNKMEMHQVKINEIICPYCRNKQKGVLPYYEDLPLSKVYGVNYVECDDIFVLCEFTSDEVQSCHHIGYKFTGNNYGHDKHYCIAHKKILIAASKAEIKKIKQQEKEQAKQEKEQAKQAKLELKHQNKLLCTQILKTGINKGSECGCIVFNDNLCKRHFNLSSK